MAVRYDVSQMKKFFEKMRTAARGDFRQQLELFLEGAGAEFLRILEDEIIRKEVMDTRLLLNSFHQGAEGNVWEITEGGLTLEVGTNVEYAAWVNDGHWTIGPNTKHFTLSNGEIARFVPGRWQGDRFQYDPSAGTGMVLKQKFVEGAHYWESAILIMEKMLPKLAERVLQQWIDSYFSF